MNRIRCLALNRLTAFRMGGATVILGIALNGVLLAVFGAGYGWALNQMVRGIYNIFAEALSLVVSVFSYCYLFTGPFLVVLGPILIFTGWSFGRFLRDFIRRRTVPMPMGECVQRYRLHHWLGSTLCGQIGIMGTLVYAIAALLTLGRAIMQMSFGFSSEDGFQTVIMPKILAAMAEAALMMAPALGTTAVAVVCETLVEGSDWICLKWHGQQWETRHLAKEERNETRDYGGKGAACPEDERDSVGARGLLPDPDPVQREPLAHGERPVG